MTNSAGNDISAATGSDTNYAFALQFSDVDMNTGTDTLSIAQVTPTISTADLQQGLTVSNTFTITATLPKLKILPANCANVKYLCAILTTGTNAGFVDSDTTKGSNIRCLSIVARKSCAPGKVVIFFIYHLTLFISDNGMVIFCRFIFTCIYCGYIAETMQINKRMIKVIWLSQ